MGKIEGPGKGREAKGVREKERERVGIMERRRECGMGLEEGSIA